MKLQDKVLFVTGAAGGIGKAAAKVCAGYGAKVIAVDMNLDGAAATAQEINEAGGQAIAVQANTTDRKQVAAAVEAGVKAFGKINCLFNNAGICRSSLLIDCEDDVLNQIVDVNIKGAYIVASELAKHMKANGEGRIISTSSISALKEEATNGFYCMSKAAVLMMTHVMAMELSKYGVTAVAVCPGHINTRCYATPSYSAALRKARRLTSTSPRWKAPFRWVVLLSRKKSASWSHSCAMTAPLTSTATVFLLPAAR